MINMNISIGIPFDSVFGADYDFEYISTVKFEPRLDHLTTRLDAVKSDDQHKHVDRHSI